MRAYKAVLVDVHSLDQLYCLLERKLFVHFLLQVFREFVDFDHVCEFNRIHKLLGTDFILVQEILNPGQQRLERGLQAGN